MDTGKIGKISQTLKKKDEKNKCARKTTSNISIYNGGDSNNTGILKYSQQKKGPQNIDYKVLY